MTSILDIAKKKKRPQSQTVSPRTPLINLDKKTFKMGHPCVKVGFE